MVVTSGKSGTRSRWKRRGQEILLRGHHTRGLQSCSLLRASAVSLSCSTFPAGLSAPAVYSERGWPGIKSRWGCPTGSTSYRHTKGALSSGKAKPNNVGALVPQVASYWYFRPGFSWQGCISFPSLELLVNDSRHGSQRCRLNDSTVVRWETDIPRGTTGRLWLVVVHDKQGGPGQGPIHPRLGVVVVTVSLPHAVCHTREVPSARQPRAVLTPTARSAAPSRVSRPS